MVYVAIVVGLGHALRSEHSVALSIAATAVVALAVPARARAGAARARTGWCTGARATPYEVMAGFAERVAGTLSVDRVLPEMAEAAARGVGASQRARPRVPAATETAIVDVAARRERPRRAGGDDPGRATRAKPVGEIVVDEAAGRPAHAAARSDLLDDLARAGGAGPAQRPADRRAGDPRSRSWPSKRRSSGSRDSGW